MWSHCELRMLITQSIYFWWMQYFFRSGCLYLQDHWEISLNLFFLNLSTTTYVVTTQTIRTWKFACLLWEYNSTCWRAVVFLLVLIVWASAFYWTLFHHQGLHIRIRVQFGPLWSSSCYLMIFLRQVLLFRPESIRWVFDPRSFGWSQPRPQKTQRPSHLKDWHRYPLPSLVSLSPLPVSSAPLFLVCPAPSEWDLIGCWSGIFSCSPVHWLKKSLSSLGECALSSSALSPACLLWLETSAHLTWHLGVFC